MFDDAEYGFRFVLRGSNIAKENVFGDVSVLVQKPNEPLAESLNITSNEREPEPFDGDLGNVRGEDTSRNVGQVRSVDFPARFIVAPKDGDQEFAELGIQQNVKDGDADHCHTRPAV